LLSKDHETKYFGVLTAPNNANELVEWADIIICASEEIRKTFEDKYKTSVPIYHLHVNGIGFGFKKEIEEELEQLKF